MINRILFFVILAFISTLHAYGKELSTNSSRVVAPPQALAQKCSFCKGTGKCGTCGGSGKIVCGRCHGTGSTNDGDMGLPSSCPTCRGGGLLFCKECNASGVCRQCNGTGSIPKQ